MSGRAELRFAHGKNLGASRGSWYALTVHEGRNRLVRRLFEHFGHRVVRPHSRRIRRPAPAGGPDTRKLISS